MFEGVLWMFEEQGVNESEIGVVDVKQSWIVLGYRVTLLHHVSLMTILCH